MRRLLTSCASAACGIALAASAAAAPFDVLDVVSNSLDLDGAAAVAPSPDGDFVYVCAQTASTLVAYAVDAATGELELVDLEVDSFEEEGVDGLAGCVDLVLSPDGRFVYTAGRFDNAIGIFSRDPANGELEYVGIFSTTQTEQDDLRAPFALALSPGGAFLYAVANFSDTLVVFSRNAATGALALVEVERDDPQRFLEGPNDVVVSHDGASVYVTAEGELSGGGFADALLTFSRDAATGEVTLVDTERNGAGVFFSLELPNAIAATRDLRDVYVAASFSNAISIFARLPEPNPTQWLGFVDGFSPGAASLLGPTSLALTRDGTRLLTTATASNGLVVFTRNQETGALVFERAVLDDATPERRLLGAIDVAIDPRGRFVYVVAFTDDSLTVLAPEPGTAALGAAAVAALAARRRRSRKESAPCRGSRSEP